MIDMLKRALASRKWSAAIVAAILPVVNAKFGWNLSENTVLAVLGIITAVILGESYVDGKRVEGVPPPPLSK